MPKASIQIQNLPTTSYIPSCILISFNNLYPDNLVLNSSMRMREVVGVLLLLLLLLLPPRGGAFSACLPVIGLLKLDFNR
jgi:hypothetical protein